MNLVDINHLGNHWKHWYGFLRTCQINTLFYDHPHDHPHRKIKMLVKNQFPQPFWAACAKQSHLSVCYSEIEREVLFKKTVHPYAFGWNRRENNSPSVCYLMRWKCKQISFASMLFPEKGSIDYFYFTTIKKPHAHMIFFFKIHWTRYYFGVP